MNKIIAECAAVGSLALRDLILVVREDKILSAAVNVDRITQILLDHGRALDVPAGSSLAPRRSPERLAFLLKLPYSKVTGILLAFVRGLTFTAAGYKVIEIIV